jgi:hypothetical protein
LSGRAARGGAGLTAAAAYPQEHDGEAGEHRQHDEAAAGEQGGARQSLVPGRRRRGGGSLGPGGLSGHEGFSSSAAQSGIGEAPEAKELL